MADSQNKENKAWKVVVFKSNPRNEHPRYKLCEISKEYKQSFPVIKAYSFPKHCEYSQKTAPADKRI